MKALTNQISELKDLNRKLFKNNLWIQNQISKYKDREGDMALMKAALEEHTRGIRFPPHNTNSEEFEPQTPELPKLRDANTLEIITDWSGKERKAMSQRTIDFESSKKKGSWGLELDNEPMTGTIGDQSDLEYYSFGKEIAAESFKVISTGDNYADLSREELIAKIYRKKQKSNQKEAVAKIVGQELGGLNLKHDDAVNELESMKLERDGYVKDQKF